MGWDAGLFPGRPRLKEVLLSGSMLPPSGNVQKPHQAPVIP